MSRTYRSIPNNGWEPPENLAFMMRHGLISMPKAEVDKSGQYTCDETWGQRNKKFRKHLISRSRRLQDRKSERDVSDGSDGSDGRDEQKREE